jgi:hypothetical protein
MGATVEQALAHLIAITAEVWEAALSLHESGVLVFGVSDKPDEASVPSAQQAEQGMLPLHHLETAIIGEA